VRARFSAPVHTCSGTHPAYCTTDTGSFPGVKRLIIGEEHLPPYSAVVKERAELYLYSPSGPPCYRVNFAFTYIFDMLDKHKDSYLIL